jgi:hypothetical protein
VLLRHVLNLAAGLAAAFVGSALLSLGVSVTAGMLNHPLESMPWLVSVSALPAAAAAMLIGVLPQRAEPTFRRVCAVAAVTAFLVVAVAGSAGAIAVQALRSGISSVNVVGYLVWCGVYAAALLPVTAPLAACTVRFTWRRNG